MRRANRKVYGRHIRRHGTQMFYSNPMANCAIAIKTLSLFNRSGGANICNRFFYFTTICCQGETFCMLEMVRHVRHAVRQTRLSFKLYWRTTDYVTHLRRCKRNFSDGTDSRYSTHTAIPGRRVLRFVKHFLFENERFVIYKRTAALRHTHTHVS